MRTQFAIVVALGTFAAGLLIGWPAAEAALVNPSPPAMTQQDFWCNETSSQSSEEVAAAKDTCQRMGGTWQGRSNWSPNVVKLEQAKEARHRLVLEALGGLFLLLILAAVWRRFAGRASQAVENAAVAATVSSLKIKRSVIAKRSRIRHLAEDRIQGRARTPSAE